MVVGPQSGEIMMGGVRAEHVVGDEDVGIAHPLGCLGEVFDGQWIRLYLCLGKYHSDFQISLLDVSIFFDAGA